MNVQDTSQLRERRDVLRSRLDEILEAPTLERRNLTADEAVSFEALEAEIRRIDSQLKTESKMTTTSTTAVNVTVGAEERAYRRGGQHSFLKDMVASLTPAGVEARERLARHQMETRANMNTTDGTGGEMVPPTWLVDQYVPLARAGRIAAELVSKQPLPGGTDQINLPKVATGTAVAEQSSQNSTVQKTDMTTSTVTGNVTTLSGQQVFAMQLLDQSPVAFDEFVFKDLLADLAKQVDTYVLSKTSIGLLNLAGTNSVTYTDTTPTVGELYPKIANAVQLIETNRFLPPTGVLMHPSRWAWFLAALDSSGRPLVVPKDNGGSFNAVAGMDSVRAEGLVGSVMGLPVWVDANIPTNLGGGTEDRVIVAKWDDLYLYESEIRTRTLLETDADSLSVRVQVYEYLAWIPARFPKSVSIVSGSGLAAPTF